MMIKQNYLKEVLNFGISLFSSDSSDEDFEATFTQIDEDIIGIPQGRQMNAWYFGVRDALTFILRNCSEQEMDNIVSEFNLRPETLGGGKAFLKRCYKAINDALVRLYGVE